MENLATSRDILQTFSSGQKKLYLGTKATLKRGLFLAKALSLRPNFKVNDYVCCKERR